MLHVRSRAGHLVAGVLALDVGRAWCDLGSSNAGRPEDRQRSGAPLKALGHVLETDSDEAEDIGLCAPEAGVHHRLEPLEKGSPAPNAAGLPTWILPMLSPLFPSGYAS